VRLRNASHEARQSATAGWICLTSMDGYHRLLRHFPEQSTDVPVRYDDPASALGCERAARITPSKPAKRDAEGSDGTRRDT